MKTNQLWLMLGITLWTIMPLSADDSSTQQPNHPATVKLTLKGGLSPKGQYQIWVIGTDATSEDYAFGFYGDDPNTPLFEADVGGGFCNVAGASSIDSALWKEDESMVAINDHGTRHSMEIHVLQIRGRKAIEIPLPKFGDAVSRAMANLHGGAETAWCLKPLKWEGSKFTFRLFGGPNWSDVTVRMSKTFPAHATLISETPPKEITEGMEQF